MISIKEKLDLLLELMEITNDAEIDANFHQQLIFRLLPSENISEMLRFIDEDIMRTHSLLNLLKSQKSKFSENSDKETNKLETSSGFCDAEVQVDAPLKTVDHITRPQKSKIPVEKIDIIEVNSKNESITAEEIPKKVHFIKSNLKIFDKPSSNSIGSTSKEWFDGMKIKHQSNKIFRSIATETIDLIDNISPNIHQINKPNEEKQFEKQSFNISLDETIYLKLPDQIRHPKDILERNFIHLAKGVEYKSNREELDDNGNFELDLEQPPNQDNDLTFNSIDNTALFKTLSASPSNTSTPKQPTQNQTKGDDISSIYESFLSSNTIDHSNASLIDISSPNISQFDKDQFWQSILQNAGLNKTLLD